jgi:hypothetical protein
MTRRILWITAALAALLLTGSTVYAQTDDWIKGSPPGLGGCLNERDAVSYAQNNRASASFIICWHGTDVWVSPTANDRYPGDGRGAAAQISYFVKINGSWRQHERIAAFDRTPNGSEVTPGWFKSRYPTTRLLVRACLSKPNQPNTVDERTCDRYR